MSFFDDENLYKKSLVSLLIEAEEDEETEEEAEEDEQQKKGSFESSIDADLDAILIDFETEARDAVVQSEGTKRSVKMIYEETDIDEINIQDFASNVARLVKNYENLLDMESILVSRAGEFLKDRYGEDAEAKLTDELESVHDIEIKEPPKLDDDLKVPLALGAKSGEG